MSEKMNTVWFHTGNGGHPFETVENPKEEHLWVLAENFRLARRSETRWRTVSCPVNGDGYQAEVRVLRDASTGEEVGTYDTGRVRDLPYDYFSGDLGW